MISITFGIPTWNRAEKLEKCVRNLAQKIELEYPSAKIFVSDNASDDKTAEVLLRLKREIPFFDFVRKPTNTGILGNISNVLRLVNSDYIWLFGDDDLLYSGGLKRVTDTLNGERVDICMVGSAWFAPHCGALVQGSLLQIVSKLGFNQSLGFQTADIISLKVAKEIIELNLLDFYKKDAFGHVPSFLHVAAHKKAFYIDIPAVSPMEVQQAEDLKRWEDEKMLQRYFYFVDSLKHLMEIGKIPQKLPTTFFRYLSYNLWDRFIVYMLVHALRGEEFVPNGWQYVRDIAQMIDDPEMAKMINASVDSVLAMLELKKQAIAQATFAHERLNSLAHSVAKPVYPSHFLVM